MQCLLALAMASGFQFSHRPLVIQHYPAIGRSSEGAIAHAEQTGPRDHQGIRYPALTQYRCRYQASFSKTPVRLETLTVTMDHTMTLPKLQDPLSKERSWVWDDWYRRLSAHEQRHYKLATQPWIKNRFETLFQAYSKRHFASREQGQALLHQEVKRILNTLDRQEREIDRKTHHGED